VKADLRSAADQQNGARPGRDTQESKSKSLLTHRTKKVDLILKWIQAEGGILALYLAR